MKRFFIAISFLQEVGIYNAFILIELIILLLQDDKDPYKMEIGKQGSLRHWQTGMPTQHYVVTQNPSGMQGYCAISWVLLLLLLVCC